ncbi:MAG: PKD domain-containing protein [Gemmatimonadaceae bacterium]|nr:PKD domain-containing protein [Gemmatimonadaceae bacterium]
MTVPSVRAALNPPPEASLSVKVTVPASMRSSPFNVDRFLTIPPNFSVAVYARVGGARFMAAAPNGDLLVSNPGASAVYLVRPSTTGGDPAVTTWASGLYKPHDIVFHEVGGITYVYVAEADKIARYVYTTGDLTGQQRQVIISGLPNASTPELGGNYGHELKNIALDGDNKLYVSIASTCNVCLSDTQSTPVRASMYVYNADGTSGRLFAQGLRNAEGLAFVPGTNTLWVVINNRDNIAYPFHNDWSGDGIDDYGLVMQSYVDNHPPDEFTRVRDGGNYGWPFCNPNPDTPDGMNNMPFDRDVEQNADGARLDCNTADRIDKGIQAHSAPLGLTFLQGTNAPLAYRDAAVVPLHGSWNRSVKTGAKVVLFPWDPAIQMPGQQIDLVSGWLVSGSYWGRPVDAAVGPDGAIYISDDQSGTIYKLTYSAPPPPPPPPPAPPPPPPPPPPGSVAQFTYSCSNLTCSFNGSGSTGATSWSWAFGDGGTATGVTTSHTYKRGNYTVTLTTAPAGSQSTATKTVRCKKVCS